MALVNRYALVEYDVGGARLWHERWVLEHISNDEYVVATPDKDIYVEDLSLLNEDIRGIRVRSVAGQVPAGVVAAQIYGLPAWSAAELAALRAEARRVAQEERVQRAGGGAVAAGGLAVAVAPAPGLVGSASDHPTGIVKWLAAEAGEGHKFGEEVKEVQVAEIKGSKHVHDFGGGRTLFCECVDGGDLETFLQKPSKCDYRLMVQRKNGMGQPEKNLQEVAQECVEVPVTWVLPGPRTARWCINYLAVEGLGFEGHHERVRQICKVDGSAWGIAEHFQTSMALRQALLVDQLNGSNLLSVEIQFRRLQTIEFSYAEKAREAENRSMPGKLSLEEQSSFGGVTRQFSTLMICPSLLEHVKTETEKEAVLQKSLRKAREEREAAKKASAGKKKAGGEDQ